MTCDLCTCTSLKLSNTVNSRKGVCEMHGHHRHLYACETCSMALRTLFSLKMSLEVRQVKFDDGFGLGV